MSPRARIILGVLLGVYGLIVLRAFQIQVLGVEGIRERGARQYSVKIPLLPKRGVIFDRTGTEFAVSLSTKSIYVQPSKLSSPDLAAKILSRRISRPAAQLRKAFSSDRNFLWVKRQMPSSLAEEIVREVRDPTYLLIAAKVVSHSNKDKVRYSIHDIRTQGLMKFYDFLDKARQKVRPWIEGGLWKCRFSLNSV